MVVLVRAVQRESVGIDVVGRRLRDDGARLEVEPRSWAVDRGWVDVLRAEDAAVRRQELRARRGGRWPLPRFGSCAAVAARAVCQRMISSKRSSPTLWFGSKVKRFSVVSSGFASPEAYPTSTSATTFPSRSAGRRPLAGGLALRRPAREDHAERRCAAVRLDRASRARRAAGRPCARRSSPRAPSPPRSSRRRTPSRPVARAGARSCPRGRGRRRG